MKAFIIILIGLITTNAIGQVGIGNTNPRTALDVTGALSLRTGGNLTLSDGTNNNISLGTNPYSLYRITGPSAAFTITSIETIDAGNTDGQILVLENNTNQNFTLQHNSGGTGRNRILCPGSRNLTLSGRYATVTLIYETNHNRWVVINYADNRYGDNIQSVAGTSDALIGTATYTDMPDMEITFTPNHSVVYLTFSAAGHVDISTFFTLPTHANFRVVNVTAGDTIICGTTTIASDHDFDDVFGVEEVVAWNAQIAMYPIAVTPGTSTTLKIQWMRDGSAPEDLLNSVASAPDFSHRVLTIFD